MSNETRIFVLAAALVFGSLLAVAALFGATPDVAPVSPPSASERAVTLGVTLAGHMKTDEQRDVIVSASPDSTSGKYEVLTTLDNYYSDPAQQALALAVCVNAQSLWPHTNIGIEGADEKTVFALTNTPITPDGTQAFTCMTGDENDSLLAGGTVTRGDTQYRRKY